MAADPIKAVMVLKEEIDKARQEYQKKLADFQKLAKKIAPKNKRVAATVLDELAIKVEKVRVQILTDKQTIWNTVAQLKTLRDNILKEYSYFDDIRNQLVRYKLDLNAGFR